MNRDDMKQQIVRQLALAAAEASGAIKGVFCGVADDDDVTTNAQHIKFLRSIAVSLDVVLRQWYLMAEEDQP